MTKSEYFQYCIREEYPLLLDWVFAAFGIIEKDNEYVKPTKTGYEVKVDNEWVVLKNAESKKPILDFKEDLILQKDVMSIVTENIETSYGNAIVNYIFIEYSLNGKFRYLNNADELSIGWMESNIITPNLTDNPEEGVEAANQKPGNENKIFVEEYITFVDATTYCSAWVPLAVHSSSPKMVMPPKGIDEFKNKIMKEMTDKYGPDCFKDYARVVELEKHLKDFDNEWVKDDPTYGIVMTNKIKGISRKRNFLVFGAEAGFVSSPEAHLVSNSLEEGLPKDGEDLAALFNTMRLGAFASGASTQTSGANAKTLSRATDNFVINPGDCGVKYGYKFILTEDLIRGLVFSRRRLVKDNKIIESKKDLEKYINKEVEIRSPMACLSKGDSFCEYCMGDKAKDHRNGVTVLAMDAGGVFLNEHMKARHGTILETFEYDMNELIK